VWRGFFDFSRWVQAAPELAPGENAACPGGCATCEDHLQNACCVLLPVTDRCNLNCTYCVADPGNKPDPLLEQIKTQLGELTVPGQTLVQLSGGEPTTREDLTEIIGAAKAYGCAHVQLNTNGIRLGEDAGFVKKLADAGLSFVFMQFDGLDDGVYKALRNRPLLEIKIKAIEHCGRHNIGVVLVPTMVPGINTAQAGEIVRFAVERSPVVRGVHFQPVSYFGRSPVNAWEAPRYTLDGLLNDIITQSGLVSESDFAPSRCDHPLCGFHGDFIAMPDGTLKPLKTRETELAPCCGPGSADKNRDFVARRWSMSKDGVTPSCCEPDLTDMEQFAARAGSHGFTITAMAFQDAATLDIARLRQCSLHVYAEGRHVPFCAYYL
jgi:uncharacterized radical SAM superfamily Fe-S cluster-containing enzyme